MYKEINFIHGRLNNQSFKKKKNWVTKCECVIWCTFLIMQYMFCFALILIFVRFGEPQCFG